MKKLARRLLPSASLALLLCFLLTVPVLATEAAPADGTPEAAETAEGTGGPAEADAEAPDADAEPPDADAESPEAAGETAPETADADAETPETAEAAEGDTAEAEVPGEAEAGTEAEEDEAPAPRLYGTWYALLPPLIAIVLALITKEAYSSLFLGVLVGAFLACDFHPVRALDTVIGDGLMTAIQEDAGIFLFLVLLGTVVALVNAAGGSAAFGRWAEKNIHSRVGAQLATFILGVLIFIDDYFNCLTVGSVMRPVTDSQRISRAKLAFLIDATAAPVCMIAPVSSWAAAVSGTAEKLDTGISGIQLFIQAIPYNLYSLLTLLFIVLLAFMGFDYGPMRKYEKRARRTGDLGALDAGSNTAGNPDGRIADLVLPVVVLIAACTAGMLYVGGFFGTDWWGGTDLRWDFIGAFGNTDAFVGLPWGSVIALVLIVAYLLLRRVVSFKDAMACIPKGFNAMVPAMLILTLAVSLKNLTSTLGAAEFVHDVMAGAAENLYNSLPAVIFLVACVLAFASGTSWGTFGILIPIVTAIFPAESPLLIIGISACLAGAVCGDHCSPISDTTIMASAGAQVEHINHVSTQLPYAITVAVVSFGGFLVAGFTQDLYMTWGASAGALLAVLVILRIGVAIVEHFEKKNEPDEPDEPDEPVITKSEVYAPSSGGTGTAAGTASGKEDSVPFEDTASGGRSASNERPASDGMPAPAASGGTKEEADETQDAWASSGTKFSWDPGESDAPAPPVELNVTVPAWETGGGEPAAELDSGEPEPPPVPPVIILPGTVEADVPAESDAFAAVEADTPAPVEEAAATEMISIPEEEVPVPVEEPAAVEESPVPVEEIPVSVEEPAPVVEIPVPVEEPAPVEETPVPVEEPAPVEEIPVPVEEPAPVMEEIPVPVEEPAPVVEIPVPVEEPAPVEEIPAPEEEPVSAEVPPEEEDGGSVLADTFAVVYVPDKPKAPPTDTAEEYAPYSTVVESVTVEVEPDVPAPVEMEPEPDVPAPVEVEAEPDVPAPVEVEAEPDIPAPVEMEPEPDVPAPVEVEAESDDAAPVETEPDIPAPVEAEADDAAPVETEPDNAPDADAEPAKQSGDKPSNPKGGTHRKPKPKHKKRKRR